MSFTRFLSSSKTFNRRFQQQIILTSGNSRPFSVLHLTTTPANVANDESYFNYRTHIAKHRIRIKDTELNSTVNLNRIMALQDKHSVELMQRLLSFFDPTVMAFALTQVNSKFEFSGEMSSQVLNKFIMCENIENLIQFRKLLLVRKNANIFKFSIGDINKTIRNCLERGYLVEALNWYIISQDVLHLKPHEDTFSLLVNAFSNENKWDELLYLLSEMQYQGIPLSSTSSEAILRGAALHPSSRWRHALRVIEDLFERSVTTKLDTKTDNLSQKVDFQEMVAKASRKSAQTYCLTPRVFGSVLLTAIEAKQPTAVRALYDQIVAAHLKIETGTGDALLSHSVLPVHSDETVVPLGVTAILLEDHSFLCDILRRNTTTKSNEKTSVSLFSDSHLLNQTLSPESAVNVYGALLVNDTVKLLKHRHAVDCGRQFGVVMVWCIRHNKTVLAVQLWNVLIQELIASLQTALSQKSDDVVTALSHVLSACCSSMAPATTDLSQYQHNKKIANVLNGALFNMNSNTSSKSAPDFVSVTAADVSQMTDISGASDSLFDGILSVDMKVDAHVANAMLSAFTHLQDNKAAFELLSRCLRHDIAVNEKVMDDLFDLLVADGDHKLVLDLCEFSIKQMDDAYHAERVAKLTARHAVSLPRIASRPDKELKSKELDSISEVDERGDLLKPKDRGFSPYVFTVAMKSLLALGDVDSIVRLLGQEIPSKGFAVSNHNYELAVRALYSHGRYEEAVRLFQQGVADKIEHVNTHKRLMRQTPEEVSKQKLNALQDPTKTPVRRINFSNYSIAADSLHNNEDLLLCSLQCAARARLAEDALTIFSERENLSVRGLAPMSPQKRCDLVDQVVVSLSSQAHIGILADFLRSTSTLTDGFVPPVQTIQLAIAAAVAVRDTSTVGAVLEYASQFSFSVQSDLTRERLMQLVQNEVRVELGQLPAVQTFVENCVHFKGMQ